MVSGPGAESALPEPEYDWAWLARLPAAPAGPARQLLEAAHSMAALGWPVFPVHTPTASGCSCSRPDCDKAGKHPRTENGLLGATTDPDLIRRWWEDVWPDANIGAVVPEGFFVLDIDGSAGEAALAALALPTTATIRTGRGRHLIFRTRDRVGPKVRVLPQVDVRGPRSYIVVPPSRHANGTRYEWLQPIEHGIADAPQELVRLIAPARPSSVAAPPSEPIPEGERNATLTSLAGSMRRRGMTPLAIEAALLAENAARCRPPLLEREVHAIAASVGRYEPASSASDGAARQRDRSDESDRSTAAWPEPPAASAYHGLAGRIVEAIDPHTEGDPVAVLCQTLVMFGSAIGSGPHAMVGATRHGTNTNVMVVGDTAKARKGDSLSHVRRIFGLADSDWCNPRILSGFGSGEGVMWAVRDEVTRQEPIRERGRVVGYETVVVDEGEPDKRLLVVEPELARILRVAARQGSVLSMILREAWDGGDLEVITKGLHLRATAAHVSAIGHITAEELHRELSDTEAANGFMNRWLVLAVRRSKLLPEPEPFEGQAVELLAEELRRTIAFARAEGRIERSPAARELWAEVYPLLSQAHSGLVGAMLARAEAQVLRLSLNYALLDRSALVEPAHLVAALEVWGYAERSIRFLFGEATGNPLADRILRALDQAGELTRTEIRDLSGRHASETQVDAALGVLLEAGRARVAQRATGGRPVEVWQRA